jgi:hypothetical protein
MTIIGKYSADYQPIFSDWKPPEWLLATFSGINKKIDEIVKQQFIDIKSGPALNDCKIAGQLNQNGGFIPKLLEKLRQNPLFEQIFQFASINGPPIQISITSNYPKEYPPSFVAHAKNSEGQPIRGIVIRHHPDPLIIMGLLIFEFCNAFHQPQLTTILERLSSSKSFDREEYVRCKEYIENKTLNLSIDILQYGEKHLGWKILPMEKVSFAVSWERSNIIDSSLGSHADLYRRQWDQMKKNSHHGIYSKITELFSSIRAFFSNYTSSLQPVLTSVAEANGLSNTMSKTDHPNEIPQLKKANTFSVEDIAFKEALEHTPKFAGYQITLPKGHFCEGIVLTGINIRPSNLFFFELFKNTNITTTMPGSGKLFAFNAPYEKIRNYIKQKAEDSTAVVEFSAKDVSGHGIVDQKTLEIADLSCLYGTNTYKISFKEIKNILDSQKIYTSSLLPLPFYKGLKEAMSIDNIVILPGNDSNPVILKELQGNKAIGEFLRIVKEDPEKFGFSSMKDFEELCEMTLYQIGSMIVKSEDYRIFMDGHGKILAREPGKNDAIRLINSCGIRGLHSLKTPEKCNKRIMTENFKTDLIAAENGVAIFPAVGMGIWGGNPDLYWRAFLDAIISQENLDVICVNPGHQMTRSGKYAGCQGEEFQTILDEYKICYANDPKVGSRLEKILNLHESKKDIVQLAHQLKLAYPEKIVSLFNASDPDVSLGYHVGEYVNNWPHTITTEENYTAMGSNGLCFEGITDVHSFPNRLLQT